MKKRFSILLMLAALIVSVGIPANAQTTYRYIGDVDGDDTVSILDATLVQKQLASLQSFSKLQKFLGDVDNSKTTDIIDVTMIQKKLASLIDSFYKERIQSWSAEIYGIESSNSGNTYLLNTEYTFSVSATQRPVPDDFRVLVDREIVLDKSEEASFAYTFTEAGVHYIRAYCFGAFGGVDSYLLTVIVTDPDIVEKPEIERIDYNKATGQVDVAVSGGTAPYQYSYTVRQVPPPPPEAGPNYVTSSDFVFRNDIDGTYYLYCDFCSGVDVFVPTYLLEPKLSYTLEAQVIDQSGVLSDIKTIYIQR